MLYSTTVDVDCANWKRGSYCMCNHGQKHNIAGMHPTKMTSTQLCDLQPTAQPTLTWNELINNESIVIMFHTFCIFLLRNFTD